MTTPDLWTTPSTITLSRGELYDYIGTRIMKTMKTITTNADFVTAIDAEAVTPNSFLLLSTDAAKTLESYGSGFNIEYNTGDTYSGKVAYKTQTVGEASFSSYINCLLFDAPGESIGFIAKVDDFRNDPAKAGVSLSTLNTIWGNANPLNLVQTNQLVLNDANGRGFLINRAATGLVFITPPVPETLPVNGVAPSV